MRNIKWSWWISNVFKRAQSWEGTELEVIWENSGSEYDENTFHETLKELILFQIQGRGDMMQPLEHGTHLQCISILLPFL